MIAKQNAYGERYYEEASGNVFANSSSKTIFERYFKDAFDTEYQLYIIVGTDSGLLPVYLHHKYQDDRKGRKFVFIEQPEIMAQLDVSDLPEWLTVVSSEHAVKDLSANWIDYMMTKRLGLYKSIAIIDKLSDQTIQLWNNVKDQYSNLRFTDLANNHTRPFVEAQLKNAPRNNFPIKNLRSRLQGKTAVVIAGGPSLDSLIDWIKEHREALYIFAVGRVSKRLHKEGLTPDFITSVDPHELSYDNSKQMFYFSQQSILLACYHIAPRLLSQWSGAAAYFGELYPWQEGTGNSNSPGPTVLHSTIVQAAYLGCETIYLAGADLCFYNGQTHASGSAEEEVGQLGIKNTAQVMTYSGELADTDVPFSHGVEALNSIAQNLNKQHGIQIYNLSPFAARVEHVAHQSPESVVIPSVTENQADESKKEKLEQIKADIECSPKEMGEQLADKLKVMQKERRLIVASQATIKQAVKSIANFEVEFSPKALDKAQSLRLQMDKKLGEKNRMLFYFGYNYFSQVMKPVEDKAQLSNEEIAHTLTTYFDGMKKSMHDFLKLLDLVIADIKFMQKELSIDSQPCDCIERWSSHKEWGRALLWQKYHPILTETVEDQKQQACLDKAKSAFLEDISIEQTLQSARLQAVAFSVVNLIDKIVSAFEARSQPQLEALLKPVSKLKNESDRKGLTQFIEGGLMIIKEGPDSQSFISAFELNKHPKLQVYLQKYLLNHYMQREQHEKALETLQILCKYSKDYLLTYADYLNILGRPDLATEAALELFRQEQTNLPALIKVVHFANKAGLKEVFSDALNVALSMDPNHPELMVYLQTH